MANAGGGNFYYVANEGQIVDYVTSEVGEALMSWPATSPWR